MLNSLFLSLSTVVACAGAGELFAAASAVESLADHPELVLSASQAWGELGYNTAAHQSGQSGIPLAIGAKTYTSGLGHHANGKILVALDGEYSCLDGEVGLQPCDGGGSVVFRAWVDGKLAFESGVMRGTNPPTPLHVELAGAQDLCLEAADAGDGITCDMANWAEARLTRTARDTRSAPEPEMNMARFGRIVTWDPNRQDGCRASRLEEFRAEDLFLETDLPVRQDGGYLVPATTNGLACVGVQWLNNRALKELRLEFNQGAALPPSAQVRVESWTGESAWQGKWQAIPGEISALENAPGFRFVPASRLVQTRKIRWVFPAGGPVAVRNLVVLTRSRWQDVELCVQTEKSQRCELAIENGDFLDGVQAGRRDFSQPVSLKVRSSRRSSIQSDPTVLRFRFPAGECAVAVEDVLSRGCVYLPDYGLFVSRHPAPTSLADYKQKVASSPTILEQVRRMPDQTRAQAMAKTHHAAQSEGPVMLSLACDNTKYVVERDGTVRFQATAKPSGDDWFATAGELRPVFGEGRPDSFHRTIEGAWLPVPLLETEQGGVRYGQRVFVAPADDPGGDPARLNRQAVCVIEFALTNSQAAPAPASLQLRFLDSARQGKSSVLPSRLGAGFTLGDGSLQGMLFTNQAGPLSLQVRGGTVTLTGTLSGGQAACVRVLLADPRLDLTSLPSPSRLRAAVEDYWKSVLAPAMQVETPDPGLDDVIRSSQVRCLIAARNEAGGARVAPWIAAMSYGPLESEAHSVIRGMQFIGHQDFARRGLDYFIHRYNTNGFLTTGYTTFGTGWHLWTVGEFHRLYQDPEWLRSVAPELARAGDWVVRQTRKTQASSGPEHGLMPPGVLADWNAFAYHFAMSGYYHAALAELAEALAGLDNRHSRAFRQKAGELKGDILRAYAWTQARSPALPLKNGAWIPHYPSQVHSPGRLANFFPGQDVGRSWCYDVELGAHQLVPSGVLAPDSRETERLLDHMEDVQFLADGWFDYPASSNEQDWFNLGGFSKVQPFYTRNAEIYALRDDIKPFLRSYFNAQASLLNPEVLAFWEHFHHSGAWDKTHETGYFLHQTRLMLVQERDRDLWLAPLITTNWLTEGCRLNVGNAPTRFGPVSFRIASHVGSGSIQAWIEPPTRTSPREIVLRLRHPGQKPIRSVQLNGREFTRFDSREGLLHLKPIAKPLNLVVSYE